MLVADGSRESCRMPAKSILLDSDERSTLLMALFERQQFLRANLDRVRPAMTELGEDELHRHEVHKANVFDSITALVIKLGGDPTDDLFGAMAVKHEPHE